MFGLTDSLRSLNLNQVLFKAYLPESGISKAQRNGIWEAVRPYTMTSRARIEAVIKSVVYIIENKIAGDFVECGVWRGGSMMAAALSLKALGIFDRQLYLYDTYQGMTPPGQNDQDIKGVPAQELLSQAKEERQSPSSIWCEASLEDVQKNMNSVGYPRECIHYIKGDVVETIPGVLPSSIALLRLDTDWYESTRHELEHLYPLLKRKGLMILDDYGHWQGAKKATDEYLAAAAPAGRLHLIDYTGRLHIKA